ncbi:MAG: fibronectin type III domain-containing protein [Acidimicrobiales bacterium]|nr:fibronectin type III domain-containing protein [Acidimicrobiales bacterium]
MESEEQDQWSWWQPDAEEATTARMAASPLLDPDSYLDDSSSPDHQFSSPNDPVRMFLIALVAVLSVTLAAVSYARFSDGAPPRAVAAATTAPPTTTTGATESPTTAAPATAAPTSISQTIVPVTSAPATTSTTFGESRGTPDPPLDVTVVSTSSTGAEIRWRSDECVGSRYQVGDFEEGGGGFPDVERCWFNHVILAGDPAFSPPLTPNTAYTVTIQAVNRNGDLSEPVFVQFTTSP